MRLVAELETPSSTVHANSLNFTFQIIASLLADVELGDVSGAFRLSDMVKREEGEPSASLPEGIDGIVPGQLAVV